MSEKVELSKKKKNLGKVLKESNQSKESSFKTYILITSLLAILVSTGVIKVYLKWTAVPDTPDLDLDFWWGPNITDLDTSIRPYRVVFSDGMLEQLRKKFDFYRNSNKIQSLNDSWTYGVNSQALSQVFSHWQFKYNYRERVRFLNQFDHYKTNIQGLDIHFVHVKPKVDKEIQVVPLLLLHGWPSSIRDFYEAIPLLTAPRAGHEFVFEVVAPSLPGFIYSDAPKKPGLSPVYAAIIMRNLMKRLGFSQYYIQGEDFGHAIGSHMSTIFADEVLGFHTSFPLNLNPIANMAYVLGAIWPFRVDEYEDRMYPLKDKVEYFLEEFGYMHLQATKPDTLGITLNDSPLGLAAYILDRFMIFTDLSNKYKQDGGLSSYSITDLLDNIMLYWSTGSIGTAMRMYKESFANHEVERVLARIPTPVPTWALKMKHEILYHPDFMLKWKYQNLLGSTDSEYGGHFTAFERPKEFADDLFLSVKMFREFH